MGKEYFVIKKKNLTIKEKIQPVENILPDLHKSHIPLQRVRHLCKIYVVHSLCPLNRFPKYGPVE
jgi:hypothetical protein